ARTRCLRAAALVGEPAARRRARAARLRAFAVEAGVSFDAGAGLRRGWTRNERGGRNRARRSACARRPAHQRARRACAPSDAFDDGRSGDQERARRSGARIAARRRAVTAEPGIWATYGLQSAFFSGNVERGCPARWMMKTPAPVSCSMRSEEEDRT